MFTQKTIYKIKLNTSDTAELKPKDCISLTPAIISNIQYLMYMFAEEPN